MNDVLDFRTKSPLPRRIADIRRSLRMSQGELGRAIGSDQQYVSKVERGVLVPSGPKLQMIARALGVDANDIDLSLAPELIAS